MAMTSETKKLVCRYWYQKVIKKKLMIQIQICSLNELCQLTVPLVTKTEKCWCWLKALTYSGGLYSVDVHAHSRWTQSGRVLEVSAKSSIFTTAQTPRTHAQWYAQVAQWDIFTSTCKLVHLTTKPHMSADTVRSQYAHSTPDSVGALTLAQMPYIWSVGFQATVANPSRRNVMTATYLKWTHQWPSLPLSGLNRA